MIARQQSFANDIINDNIFILLIVIALKLLILHVFYCENFVTWYSQDLQIVCMNVISHKKSV
jgi:hypothetical protein